LISFEEIRTKKAPVAVIGLGYVGLPLAVALARHFDVVGFDVKAARVAELQAGRDSTLEVSPEEMAEVRLRYSCDPAELTACKVFIVAVPTPINANRVPDLGPLVGASRLLGQHISEGSVVVYESTVYPGLTEEECVPLLEKGSGLACGKDFFVGYSPERINPGDKVHTLATVVKVVAGQTPEVTDLLADLYGTVVPAGIHKAPSIKVAEAAKVIENTQRDINIALMNDVADLRAWTSTPSTSCGPPKRNGTSCRFVRGSWAATASASIPTTCSTRPRASTYTRRSSRPAGASTTPSASMWPR